ncbi:predicted protein [Nematostella vectensis]|uniref:Transposase Helix-turn-helix domain-containing protein n=1 Tax=Nematostella vectensis TaxID=45351 RepID=A7SB09_NEMVE|nr:predicted protein [Nematostella vectensis]|eukprot:XP_001631142.1 predicted protein [Nematostella vectensis]
MALNDLHNHLHMKAKKIRYWAGTKKVIVTKVKKFVRKTKTKKAKRGPTRKLSSKDEMLLTLMKIKQSLSNDLLADLFGVSTTTVSHIFNTWIRFLATELRPMIMWPDRETINQKLPKFVKTNFKNLRCTIDCSKVFISRPRNLKLQALTWSEARPPQALDKKLI